MLRNLSELFLAATLLIYVVPYLFWKFSKIDNYVPLPVVQIVSGILFGPAILGNLLPNFYNYIFTKDNINVLSGLGWLGVVFFVWTAGIHLDVRLALKNKKDMLTTSSLALAGPLLLGSIFAYFISKNTQWVGKEAMSWQFVFGIGMALAVTALPILILLMEKLEIFHLDLGKRVLRYASLDDILIWSVLAIIILDWSRLVRQVIFVFVFCFFALLINKTMPKLRGNDFWYVSTFWVVSVSLAADWSGLHYIVGGFLAGVVMKKEWFDEKELSYFKNNVLLLMMPVFFLLTGLRTSWELGSLVVIFMALVLYFIQFIGKATGVFVASKILKWPKKDWIFISTLLQTKALVEIIFCTILLDKNIITSQMFTALLIMAVLSTITTIPFYKKQLKRV